MIAIEIKRPYSEAQSWWQNFTSANVSPFPVDKRGHKDYVNFINSELIPQGGRLHWDYLGGRMLVTFRLDENYTMFLMRWA